MTYPISESPHALFRNPPWTTFHEGRVPVLCQYSSIWNTWTQEAVRVRVRNSAHSTEWLGVSTGRVLLTFWSSTHCDFD